MIPTVYYPTTRFVAARAWLGEGPIVDTERNCLFWVNIEKGEIHRTDLTTGEDHAIVVGDKVGCAVLTESGTLMAGTVFDVIEVDPDSGKTLRTLFTRPGDNAGNRFNDGKVDPAGRFWFGTMGSKEDLGQFYRHDPATGETTVIEDDIRCSNGLSWSPDRKTMYYTDTPTHVVWAYDYDLETGAVSNRRTLIDIAAEEVEGAPDGHTIDSEGHLWVALWGGSALIRVSPAGRIVEKVPVPVERPTSAAFGGPDGRTLYITSAGLGKEPVEGRAGIANGDVVALRVSVAGEPPFRMKG